jgi:two-component system, sensor histidine kinase and response regulator
MNILVVDDVEENRYLLEALLKGNGHTVYPAANGAEALERLKSEEIELIVSDILMPVMDGFQLCRMVKTDENLRHIPLIFYTATYTGPQDEEFAFKIGADRFIVKPCEPDVFMEAVRDVMAAAKSGVMSPTPEQPQEEELLKLYNERLVRKLEQKMLQLEQEVNARQEAEEKIRRMNEELEQKVMDRTAELEAVNSELEAFAYSVSHDLRAPLRAISGFTGIILDKYAGTFDQDGQRIFKVIQDNTQKMGHLIDDLLSFSRISRTEMRVSRIDMAGMARSLYHEVVPEKERSHISFIMNPLPEAWGDTGLMRQVWINLLSNAAKFSSKIDQIILEVGSRVADGENVYWVKDNGVGFDMQYAHKLFGVFQRLHGSNEFEGTGVGLALVQRIIRRHGGRVWAEGEVGKGAIFYFTLPEKLNESQEARYE